MIIREGPNGRPRPRNVVYEFDDKGFCISKYKESGWHKCNYWYKDINGNIPIPDGDSLEPDDSERVYVWSSGTHGEATSNKYKGEYWHTYFVGTYKEFQNAEKASFEYFDKFKLYYDFRTNS